MFRPSEGEEEDVDESSEDDVRIPVHPVMQLVIRFTYT